MYIATFLQSASKNKQPHDCIRTAAHDSRAYNYCETVLKTKHTCAQRTNDAMRSNLCTRLHKQTAPKIKGMHICMYVATFLQAASKNKQAHDCIRTAVHVSRAYNYCESVVNTNNTCAQ
jgi:hypothetical protein